MLPALPHSSKLLVIEDWVLPVAKLLPCSWSSADPLTTQHCGSLWPTLPKHQAVFAYYTTLYYQYVVCTFSVFFPSSPKNLLRSLVTSSRRPKGRKFLVRQKCSYLIVSGQNL